MDASVIHHLVFKLLATALFCTIVLVLTGIYWTENMGKAVVYPPIQYAREFEVTVKNHSKIRGPYRTLHIKGQGSLGDLMFQYASAYGIAQKTNSKLIMPSDSVLPLYFKGLYAPFTEISVKITARDTVTEGHPCSFDDSLVEDLPLVPEVTLCCFLQSWRYFEGYEDQIREQFSFNNDTEERALQFIDRTRSKAQFLYKDTHVTLIGIYIKQGEQNPDFEEYYTLPNKSFFMQAMAYMRNKHNIYFILACDDYSWCEQNIGTKGIVYIDNSEDEAQVLAILSKCDHIIMSGGTLGWWIGWLSGGDVVYFDKVPNVPLNMMTDYIPDFENWIPMSEKEDKI